MDDDFWIEARCAGHETLDESVAEDVLTHGDEECAAERLEEHNHGGTDGYVVEWEDGLSADQWLLHSEPNLKSLD